jgi:two-component system, NtrC family, response regulator PilR
MQQMVGRDPAFQRVMAQMARFADNDAPVLLTGETGTGKELGARVMHLAEPAAEGAVYPCIVGPAPASAITARN